MGISGGVAIATKSPVVSFSELKDGLIIVGSFENNDRIARDKATWIPKLVVRAIETKNCLTVESPGLEGGAVICGRLGGVSAVTRLVVPLTD